jgi:peptidyl-prolyl cis-trans isomerase C
MLVRRALGTIALAVAVNLAGEGAHAGEARGESVRRATDVATFSASGAAASVTAAAVTEAQLEDALAALPPFQRAMFGRTADDIRRRFLTEGPLREHWLALGASDAKIADDPAVSYAVERALSSATIRAIRASAGQASTIPMTEVEAYYEQNRDRYDSPERLQVWRILCKTRDEAQTVLDAALATPNTISSSTSFGQLARDHSQDKATALRGGDLGFLTADGKSTEPGLQVDPAIVAAARAVHDGELVRTPVPEGSYFSVVWRRGLMPAVKRPVKAVAAQIREELWRGRIKDATDRLVASLRATHLRDRDETLLDTLELPEPDRDAAR